MVARIEICLMPSIQREAVMKKLTHISGLVFVIVSMVAVSASAQTRGGGVRDQVCVYENNNYTGWQQCFAPGDQIPDLGDHRNKISSIRVFGDARLLAFADKNFQGVSLDVANDMSDLAQVKNPSPFIAATWNDKIESLRVTSRLDVLGRKDEPREVVRGGDSRDRDYRGDDRDYRYDDRDYRYDDRRRFPDSRNVVCVYEEPEYRGRFECFQAGEEISDLGRRISWNDRISSLRVYGSARVTVYRNINFRGDRVTIDRDIADLRRLRMTGSLSWNNQISSIDVNGGRGRAYGNR
jgi:Peptidase inhibitor family I36